MVERPSFFWIDPPGDDFFSTGRQGFDGRDGQVAVKTKQQGAWYGRSAGDQQVETGALGDQGGAL